MDSNIQAAIVGSLATATTGVIGWILKTKLFDNMQKKRLINDRLHFVYEPLAAIVSEGGSVNIRELRTKINEILQTHHSLVPESLIQLKNIEQPYDYISSNDVFCRHILSNYNWLKKKSKLEYDPEKIDSDLLYNFSTRRKRFHMFCYVFHFLSIICCSIGLVAVILGCMNIGVPLISYSAGSFTAAMIALTADVWGVDWLPFSYLKDSPTTSPTTTDAINNTERNT